MGKVQYNQKGYVGQSMSKRAVFAYEMGEKPLSKLNAADKDALNELIARFAPDSGLQVRTVGQLRKIMGRWGESSYHHTGKFARRTSFYHLCALFDIFNPDEWEEELTKENIWGFGIRMKLVAELIEKGEL